MVTGIESFKDVFKDFTDCYTVIGGAACDILMSEADTDFRATKDIDMILLLEGRYKEFANVFWEYIKKARYKCGWKNSEKVHFYRFSDPRPGYPVMIELFSRMPEYHLEAPQGIIPIHIDDDTSSLSAILLNDDFYNFMMNGRKIVHDISVLGAEYLIPFKMYAWLDLKSKKENGAHVNDRDLRKHKYDVFRLLQIVVDDNVIETDGLVRESIKQFLEFVAAEELPLRQINLPFEKEEGIDIIHRLYGI